MLISTACLFNELKALEASIKRTASVSSWENKDLIPRMAASTPTICPAQSYLGPAASWMSLLVTWRTALAINLLRVSQTPIGLTLWHLSNAIKQYASRGEIP